MHSALMLLALTSAFLAEWDSEAGMDSATVCAVLFVSPVIVLVPRCSISNAIMLMTALCPRSPFHSILIENMRFLKLLYVLRCSIYEEIMFYCR